MELKRHVTKIEWINRKHNSYVVGKFSGFIEGAAIARGENIEVKPLSFVDDPDTNETKRVYITVYCSDEVYDLFKQFVKEHYSVIETITFDYER